MDNNFTNNQAPKKDMSAVIALICAGVGAVMSLVGSILTCSCSASKTFDVESVMQNMLSGDMHATSLMAILAIAGALVSAAGIVFAVLALKKDAKNKLAFVALAVGAFGFLYGLLPVLTICGYNCSLNSN